MPFDIERTGERVKVTEVEAKRESKQTLLCYFHVKMCCEMYGKKNEREQQQRQRQQ